MSRIAKTTVLLAVALGVPLVAAAAPANAHGLHCGVHAGVGHAAHVNAAHDLVSDYVCENVTVAL